MFGVILATAYAFLFIFLIGRLRFFSLQGIPSYWLQGVFALKLLAGTALWFVYTYYYPKRSTADIFKYFDDGLVMYRALFSHPLDFFKMFFGIGNQEALHPYYAEMMNWSRQYDMGLYNENKTIIRFNALCDIFSFGNYHVHTVFICLLSLAGLTGIYKSFVVYLSDKRKLLFAIVFLIPSVLFWGSAVLKEGLALFSLGMLVFFYFRLMEEKFAIGKLVALLIFIFLLAITKLYVLLVAIPSLLAYWIFTKTGNKRAELKFAGVLFFLLVLISLLPSYNLPEMLADKRNQTLNLAKGGSYIRNTQENKYVLIDAKYPNRIEYLSGNTEYGKIREGIPYTYWKKDNPDEKIFVASSHDTLTYEVYFDQPAADSYIHTADLNGTYLSLVKNSPQAFINAAFRPHPFEVKGALMLLSAVENAGVIFFILFCLVFSTRRIEHKSIFCFCLLSSVLLFTLIGLTTPVLGSVVRYKIPILPFFLIGFLCMWDKSKVLT